MLMRHVTVIPGLSMPLYTMCIVYPYPFVRFEYNQIQIIFRSSFGRAGFVMQSGIYRGIDGVRECTARELPSV